MATEEVLVRMRRLLVVAGLLAPLLVAGSPPVAQATGGGVRLDRIGSPDWKPVGCEVFAGPVGTAETGYAEAFETISSLLQPPDHVVQDDLGVGPGAPHRGPYASELRQGVKAQGYDRGQTFSVSQFSTGSGVFLACMAVPKHGTIGSSPDFAAGPIIPNSLFPVTVVGVATKDGAVFDPALADFEVPALDADTGTGYDVDGHSHFPFFAATNADFGAEPGTDLRGRYVYDLTLTDANGEGWHLRADFRIR